MLYCFAQQADRGPARLKGCANNPESRERTVISRENNRLVCSAPCETNWMAALMMQPRLSRDSVAGVAETLRFAAGAASYEGCDLTRAGSSALKG
jgi:hypothetical protein